MTRTYSTLIFDLDGTLVDTLPDIHSSLNAALSVLERPPFSIVETRKAVGPGKGAFLRAVIPEENEDIRERFLTIFREIYIENCLRETRLFPGFEEVLARYAHKTLAVATNKPCEFVLKILKGVGIHHFFKTIIGPDDVTHVKPHPEMLLRILKESGSTAENSLFIGDTIHDMNAGKRAGIPFVRALYGYGKYFQEVDGVPEYSIESPAGLLEIVPAH